MVALFPFICTSITKLIVLLPIDAKGDVKETLIDLLMADPLDRTKLEKIGTVLFPAMQIQGKVSASLSPFEYLLMTQSNTKNKTKT